MQFVLVLEFFFRAIVSLSKCEMSDLWIARIGRSNAKKNETESRTGTMHYDNSSKQQILGYYEFIILLLYKQI